MAGPAPSPIVCVQVVQALVARELVEGFGRSERQAALLLGLVPSSVSQYLSGKRLGPTLSVYLGDEAARRIARATAQELTAGANGTKAVLAAAAELGAQFGPGATPPARAPPALSPELRQKLPG
ncbi:MAG: hypothetical protein ACREC5_03285, partial [Thermoplasmata archaeon]